MYLCVCIYIYVCLFGECVPSVYVCLFVCFLSVRVFLYVFTCACAFVLLLLLVCLFVYGRVDNYVYVYALCFILHPRPISSILRPSPSPAAIYRR